MSTRRYTPIKKTPVRFAEDGMPLCRWCGKRLSHPRLRYCPSPSPGARRDCYHEYMVRGNLNYMRAEVLKRDKGVCAVCGCDTEKVRRILSGLQKGFWLGPFKHTQPDAAAYTWYFRRLGLTEHEAFCGSLWQADHIKPVSEGGGECGLENIRTLCVPCHKDVTREMHRRRAEERRRRTAPLFEMTDRQHEPVA